MGKYLNLFKSALEKAQPVRNPHGLARWLADKHGGDWKKYSAAIQNPKGYDRKGKDNVVAGGDFSDVKT